MRFLSSLLVLFLFFVLRSSALRVSVSVNAGANGNGDAFGQLAEADLDSAPADASADLDEAPTNLNGDLHTIAGGEGEGPEKVCRSVQQDVLKRGDLVSRVKNNQQSAADQTVVLTPQVYFAKDRAILNEGGYNADQVRMLAEMWVDPRAAKLCLTPDDVAQLYEVYTNSQKAGSLGSQRANYDTLLQRRSVARSTYLAEQKSRQAQLAVAAQQAAQQARNSADAYRLCAQGPKRMLIKDPVCTVQAQRADDDRKAADAAESERNRQYYAYVAAIQRYDVATNEIRQKASQVTPQQTQ